MKLLPRTQVLCSGWAGCGRAGWWTPSHTSCGGPGQAPHQPAWNTSLDKNHNTHTAPLSGLLLLCFYYCFSWKEDESWQYLCSNSFWSPNFKIKEHLCAFAPYKYLFHLLPVTLDSALPFTLLTSPLHILLHLILSFLINIPCQICWLFSLLAFCFPAPSKGLQGWSPFFLSKVQLLLPWLTIALAIQPFRSFISLSPFSNLIFQICHLCISISYFHSSLQYLGIVLSPSKLMKHCVWM